MKTGIIIGAGIGGLTTAIALQKKGIKVKIFEQAEQLNEVGAGIWVAPNGLKVFEKLGIAHEIIEAGKTLEKIHITETNGKLISMVDGEKVKAKHGFSTVAIHRATLQKILTSYLPKESILLNKKCISYKQNEKYVAVVFSDGSSQKADFLINADGINSKIRNQIHPLQNLRYSGQTCWRFVSDFKLPNTEENNMYEIWSNKKGLRVGYSKINDKQVYVYVTNHEKTGGIDNVREIKAKLLELCFEFPEIVSELIQSVESEKIIRNDLFDFKPIKNWTDGRIALIGDAAHATTPNLGQGACQAIEDAWVIAEELSSNNDVISCLKKFELKRIKKATYITNTSYQFAQITNTSGVLKTMIVTALRWTPNAVNQKQLDKIYSLNF